MRYAYLIFCLFILIGCKAEDNSIENLEYMAESNSQEEDCLKWALGEDYGSLSRCQLDDVWNERHSDIFVLKGSDNYDESIKRIKNVCKERTINGR